MLQRIQTIWMAISGFSSLALILTRNTIDIHWVSLMVSFCSGFVFASSFINIFSFKNRKRQILLNNISLIINALLIGLLIFWLLNLPGGIQFPEKGIEPIFSLISIVCLFLANIYIKKDERLVKSVDRLR